MKLAVISNVGGYPWAGSEDLWRDVATLNLNAGGVVHAVVHRDIAAGPQCAALCKRGAAVKAWRRFPIHRLEGLKQSLAASFTRETLGNPEAILVSCGSLPAMCAVPGLVPFLRRTEIPFVILCQFNAECLAVSPQERDQVRAVLQRAKRCVFVSSENLKVARRQFVLELKDSVVIPNPIRFNLTQPVPLTALVETVHMASVARLEALWKGQDVLLETLADVKWKQRQWMLSFYGNGPDADYLRECVNFYGLDQRVTFNGYENDVLKLWAQNHLKVLPSRGEGMSLAMLEAMICGRPVVATNVGGVAECVSEGITGFVAAAATPECLDAALERAWSARFTWHKMGADSHIRAREIAQREPAKELLELLKHLVS